MAVIPNYLFICKRCGTDLVLERLETEKFAVAPCSRCSKVPSLHYLNAPLRNLIYSVCPLGNWRWNIEQLAKRIEVFNGRIIFGITSGGKELDPFDFVKDYITNRVPAAKQIEFLNVKNYSDLGDTYTFSKLLPLASHFDPLGVTFYAHTKGVSRNNDPAVNLWTDAMYHYNLDDIQKVDAQLKEFAITGCCKRYGKFAHFPRQSIWHYSGTFFWFRNKDLFAKKWQHIPRMKYGSEAYLSLLFKESEAGCLWGDKFQNAYKWEYIKPLVQNDSYFDAFLSEHSDYNPDWSATRSIRVVQTLDRKSVSATK